jgi:hypothetical protein
MKITEKDLEAVVNRLNLVAKTPTESWKKVNGKNVSNEGNYHIGYEYGGYCLYQMTNDGGGVRNVLSCGITTKRELYHSMQAYISGIYSK